MATVQHPSFPEDTRVVKDPAPWMAQGWLLMSDQEAEQVAREQDPLLPVRPAGNASREEWFAYAMAQPNADEAFWSPLTRDEIREKFAD